MQIYQLWLVITEIVSGMGNVECIGIGANSLNGTNDTTTQPRKAVQAMTINDCTKDELINIINRQQAEIERLQAEIKQAKSEAIKECVNKYTEMLIDEYHLRTDLQIASIKRLERKVLTEMVGGENA